MQINFTTNTQTQFIFDLKNQLITALLGRNSCGLWSCMGHCFYQSVIENIRDNLETYKNFKFKREDTLYSLSQYKDSPIILFDELYEKMDYISPEAIEKIENADPKYLKWIQNNVHNFAHINATQKFFLEFFNPKQTQKKITEDIINKYNIDTKNTLSVYYRGTDKFTEIRQPSSEEIILKITKIKQQTKADRVYLLTDQEQIRDLFIKQFKDECFFMEELPFSSTNIGTIDTITHDKLKYTKYFEVAVRLLASCEYFINHASNVATAAAMYRTLNTNTWQFDKSGNFLETK